MPGGPRPLVVALHGGVSSGEEMEAVTGFSRIADREGFVVAYPDAIGVPLIGVLRAWNDGVCCGQAHTLGISDVDFVTRLLDVLRTRFPIDGRRIYLVGYSNGGALAYRLADEAWRTIAAVGIYASAPEATGTLQSTVFSLRRVQHASLMAIHSIDDPRIAYAGTERWGVVNPPFLATGRFWADALGCRRPVPRQDRGGYLRDGDEECDAGTAVELLSLKGWTHEWAGPANLSAPDAPPALRDFDAAEQMWRFFAAHPKRERREAGPPESHPDRE